MRVAVDLTPLLGPRTGIGHVVAALAERLPAVDGIEPFGVLVSYRGRAEFERVLPPGWTARSLALPARLCHGLWRRTDRPALGGFDLVHGPNYVVPPGKGAPELVAVHDLTAWHHPELVDRQSRHNPRLLDRALARGAHIHTGSSFVAGELIDDLGISADRVHVTPYGYTPGRVGSADRGRRLLGVDDYVLAVGTIEPRKDYVGLIEAMNLVWLDHPELNLVIVGRPAWGAEELDAAIGRCRQPERVLRPGYVDEEAKADLLAGARALVYPSLYEGFGIPLLEAMAAGAPVVSTTAGSIPEVAGDAAVLVPPSDPAALAAALGELVGDRDRANALRRAGFARVERFSWDAMVDDIVAVYRRLDQRVGSGVTPV